MESGASSEDVLGRPDGGLLTQGFNECAQRATSEVVFSAAGGQTGPTIELRAAGEM